MELQHIQPKNSPNWKPEQEKKLADINEVLRWLGEANLARYDEIQALQADDVPPAAWDEQARIGFRNET